MAIKDPIPVDVLRQLIRLDPETGTIYWLQRNPEWFTDAAQTAEHACARWNAKNAGKEAFIVIGGTGYRKGAIFGRYYRRSRVVFALVNGRWPVGEIDHVNRVTGDDRPTNLREATRVENARNRGARLRSTSQFKGVFWNRQRGKWQAQIRYNDGVKRHLGLFPSEDAAARAYDIAASEHHGEFASLNFRWPPES